MASETNTGQGGFRNEDSKNLGTLVSFLSPSHKLTHDLLRRGGSPRRRWTVRGDVEEVDATLAGLSTELTRLLSDSQRLSSTLDDISTTVLKKSDHAFALDETVASHIRQGLSEEQQSYWKCQALIAAYRAVPWEYIEFGNFDIPLVLSHLEYAVQTYQVCYHNLPHNTRVDLVLTLVEASRFPPTIWKRSAAAQADIAIRGMEDWYLSACLASAQCSLCRIDGKQEEAVYTLERVNDQKQLNAEDERINSAVSHLTIQRALNYIQVDDLSHATQVLESLGDLDQNPSLMKQVVHFRQNMLLGRILRFQGHFESSLAHLEKAYTTTEQLEDLNFAEDLRDLTCDLADTLRELDKPQAAEEYLRKEFARLDQCPQAFIPKGSGRSLLEACLAEVLFAQGRLEEAERLCLETESRENLMRFGKLRLSVVLAKIYHTRSDYQRALKYWREAVNAVARFPMKGGRTTRAILTSMQVALGHLGLVEAQEQVLQQAAALDEPAEPGVAQYWIAGIRHWQKYLGV